MPAPTEDSEESWSDGDTRVKIVQPRSGFACQVDLEANLDATPSETFAVLTAPDNASIFRNIKAGGRAFQQAVHSLTASAACS